MTEFERALEECLRDLEEGASSVDECLSRYPGYAARLRPILLASLYLRQAREVQVSDEFKARVRARVMQQVQAHPRQVTRSASMAMRLSIGLVAILLALLATGTAYAQGTLPGNAFYPWKLASESAWRVVSSDPIETDLRIAARRADELIAVSKDPALASQALKTYLETAARLKREANVENEARILPLLDSQMKRLHQLGISLPPPDKDTFPLSEPATTATTIATPLLVSPTPQPYSTRVLHLTPTAHAPSRVVPTGQAPRKVAPILHSPPVIAPTTNAQFP